MATILFGQSYYLRFDPKLWAAMQPYPPLGTLYAASYVRARGYEVALFDAMLADSEAEWAAALEQEQPRYAVIYEDNFNYLSKMCLLRMRQAAFTMMRIARERGCTVIVCGSDATDHAGQYLAEGADYVLLGEGEYTLGELLDRLEERTSTPFSQILGLVYKTGEQGSGRAEESHQPSTLSPKQPQVAQPQVAHAFTPMFSARRPDIRDLDALPFPAWDLVDIPRYRKIWTERHGYYSMNMVTTRGCPYHCNWCAKPIWGQRYNVRSPENVAAELKWLKETYKPDHIWFADDIMGLKPGWLERFAELVEMEQIRVPFKCLSRADLLLRGQSVEALKRAGCQIVWMGAESGSQKILNAMEKGIKVEQVRDASRRLHEASVKVGFFLQFGYPGETLADVEKTLQMVRDGRPDDIGMSVSYPLPGTKFYEKVKVELAEKQNWIDSSDLDMLYHGPFSTPFYRQLHVVLHKEFRLRQAWAELQRALHRPNTLRPHHLRCLASLFYRLLTLPFGRWRLERLSRLPNYSPGTLSPGLTLEEAARPSSQSQ